VPWLLPSFEQQESAEVRSQASSPAGAASSRADGGQGGTANVVTRRLQGCPLFELRSRASICCQRPLRADRAMRE